MAFDLNELLSSAKLANMASTTNDRRRIFEERAGRMGLSGNKLRALVPDTDKFLSQVQPAGSDEGRWRGQHERPRDGGPEIYSLGQVTMASGASTATLTVSDLGDDYLESVLWICTGAGRVTKITSVKVGNETLTLGEGSSAFFPADLCDYELEASPVRTGLYLGNLPSGKNLVFDFAADANLTADAIIRAIVVAQPATRIRRR